MKKFSFWMLAAIMTICGATTMLTSCTESIDNPVTPTNPLLKEELVGQWILMEDAGEGYYGIPGNLHEIVYLNLENDGKGSYLFFVVDDDRQVIDDDKTQSACAFKYSTMTGSDVLISDRETIEDFQLESDLTISYDQGRLMVNDGEYTYKMHRLNDLERAQMTLWYEGLHLGGDAEDAYNINDADFNATSWRAQKSLYIYDGKGEHVDENNHKFTAVQLPWSDDVVESNLPLHFCDDVTPEHGWELVMNYCGSTISSNNNFFALYNKYTGILRFFTYIPLDMNVSSANDHAWNVLLTEDLAHHLGMRYGLPMDRKIVDKTAIGMNGTDYNVLIGPWVASLSDDKYTTPRPGWWAFDLDLSSYRPDFSPLAEQIRLQMSAWSKSSVSLTNTVKMQIKEEVPATTYNLNSLSGLVGVVKDAGTPLYTMATKIMSGNWIDAAKAGFSFAKVGYNVYTSERDKNNQPSYKVLQHIDGTISTTGMISQSVAVSGVRTPTFPLTKFETSKSTLGQGVWNIKSTPVLYQIDKKFTYYRITLPGESRPPLTLFEKNSLYHNLCIPVVYDPSSIEVELNPNVFPKDDIEYIDVQSFCGVRKDTNHETNKDYRQAFGMGRNERFDLTDQANISEDHNYNNPVFDCLFDAEDKMGLNYPGRFEEYGWNGDALTRLVGRGDSEFLLEPQTFKSSEQTSASENDKNLPCYEVYVTLVVKMKNNPVPYVYTRTYIPEIQLLNLSKAKSVVDNMTNYIEQVKKDPKMGAHEGTKMLEMQLQHMKSLFAYLKPDYETALEDVTYTPTVNGGGYAKYLFDGNLKTSWSASIAARVNGEQWEVEFKASKPITPKKYTIITDADWSTWDECNPTLWAINGKDAQGNWHQIDQRDAKNFPSDALPNGNSLSKTFTIKNPGTYQEFKLIIVNYAGSLSGFYSFFHKERTRCRIAELRFEN